MAEYYIGNRLSFNDMEQILGHPVARLNTRMSETLRSVGLRQGVAKTKNGERLEFWSVDQEEFELLTDPTAATLVALKTTLEWIPLVSIDADQMTKQIQEVNSRYSRRMDGATHRRYTQELEAALDSCVIKLQADTPLVRKKYTNPGVRVGDIVQGTLSYRVTTTGIVTQITDSGYQYRLYEPYHRVGRNPQPGFEYSGDQWDGSLTARDLDRHPAFRLGPKRRARWTASTERNGLEYLVYDQHEYQNYWYSD